MPNVVFVAPFSFDTTLRFVRAALATPGARVALVSQDPLETSRPRSRPREFP